MIFIESLSLMREQGLLSPSHSDSSVLTNTFGQIAQPYDQGLRITPNEVTEIIFGEGQRN